MKMVKFVLRTIGSWIRMALISTMFIMAVNGLIYETNLSYSENEAIGYLALGCLGVQIIVKIIKTVCKAVKTWKEIKTEREEKKVMDEAYKAAIMKIASEK